MRTFSASGNENVYVTQFISRPLTKLVDNAEVQTTTGANQKLAFLAAIVKVGTRTG